MQTIRIVQAVALMMIVALAASCAASKQYTSKLFAPRSASEKDSQAAVLRFLNIDESEINKHDWVTTDIIMGRDTSNKTTVLDNFAKTFPATTEKAKTDSVSIVKDETKPVIVQTKAIPVVEEPVAKTNNTGGVRSKKSREE